MLPFREVRHAKNKPFWGPFSPKNWGGVSKNLRMRFGRGFLSGRWWPPITSVFWVWKKSCFAPRTASLEPSPSEASSSSWPKKGVDLEKQWDFFPQNGGEKKQTWKTTWREWKLVKMNLKKKNDPLLVESKVSEEKKHLFISGIV